MAKIQAQLEGVLKDLPTKDSSGNAVLKVLDITVVVTPTAATRRRIRTSSEQKRLTIDQLIADKALPGRSEPGFVGCTVIVSGNYDTNTRILEVAYPPTTPANLPPDAPFELHPYIEIGPPETLLLGPRTPDRDGRLTVNHQLVELLDPAIFRLDAADPLNARLVPDEIKNEFGIPVNMARVPEDTQISIEGYPSSDAGPKRFIGVTVEVSSNDPGILVDPSRPQVGISRASGRNRQNLFDVEVRGGVYAGPASLGALAPQRVSIQRLDRDGQVEGDVRGFMSITANAPPGGFDTWSISKKLTPVPPFVVAPVGVRATYENAPSAQAPINQLEDMDIRDDPKTPPTPTTPP